MTKFSFEVPLKHLQDFDDLQDYFFTLSILFKEKEYSDYIQQKAREGLHTIWLDNSFNETLKADDANTLITLYNIHNFTRVVCPDDFTWTNEQQAKAFQGLTMDIDPWEIIVPIANISMFEYMKQQGAQHFAVAYRARDNFTSEQLEQIPSLHFLGMLTIEELRLIKPTSCDTGMPIKIAMAGLSLQEWMEQGCSHIDTINLGLHGSSFFKATLDEWTLNLARRNICRLKQLVNEQPKI